METLNLSGAWTLLRRSDGKTFPAALPGTDFGALLKSGEIGDPLFSGDDEASAAVARDDYSFRRTFTVQESLLALQHVHLCCDCIDTLCDILINGECAAHLNSAYLPADIDVRRYLRPGENEIELRFFSPVKFIENAQKQHALPANPNGINGMPYLRKPGCHFGWDWGPCVPYCGALASVELVGFDRRIKNIRIAQTTTAARATVTVTADGADRITMTAPDGSEIAGTGGVFEIDAPLLWSTYELSGLDTQPLYTVVLENGETAVEKKIGLRSLVLDRSADAHGETFCFLLNGERIFAKGANFVPLSALFEDGDDAMLERYLLRAREANFNMLRVWGGGSYASEALLSRCDELGILVWQDFCFACQMYPLYDETFRALVLHEADVQSRRMSLHPSLALLCGNNEIEAMFSYLPRTTKLVKAYVDYFYHALPQTVAHCCDTSYIPTSPMGEAPFQKVTHDDCGDTHMWNVWHGLKKLNYYQKRFTRFLSEFGLESLPSMKAIATFAKKKDHSVTSAPFMRHQKCVGGNQKMLFYLSELFDDPKDFADLPALTGLVQSECLKAAAVHLRQNKGRCNGCLVWQFNDVWNCPSWSMIDFEEVPKAAFFHAKHFFAPVAVTCRSEKRTAHLVAHNDTLQDAAFDLTARVLNLKTGSVTHRVFPVRLKENSCSPLADLAIKRTDVLRLDWPGHTDTVLFAPPRRLPLKPVRLQVRQADHSLTVTGDAFAYGVHIEADAAPSDNDFSLFPGESKTVEFNAPAGAVRVTCVNNMRFSHRPVRRAVKRLLYRLQPRNIANAVFYATN
ncbi:MAG: hypothetical protein IKN72_02510 [Clostridia bacterium]|nr:hypothetical protein [Clostridia bacterium]